MASKQFSLKLISKKPPPSLRKFSRNQYFPFKMSFLESLCCELLCEITSFLNRPTDLKSLCLVSNAISAVSTRRLYGDLVIPNDVDNTRGIHSTVEALSGSKGIQYVRTLHVGECSLETTRALDRLLAVLCEDSLLRFSYLVSHATRFPTMRQAKHICLYQKKICNLQPGNFLNTLPDLPGQISSRFLRSITELCFYLSRAANEMEVPLTRSEARGVNSPCWPMEMVNSVYLRKLELSFDWVGGKPRLATVFSVHSLPNLTHLRFNECLFEDREVDLTKLPKLTHLVLSDCYNIASGITIPGGTTLKSLELSVGNRDTQIDANDRVFDHGVSSDFPLILNSFQGLEVMIIDAKLSQMSEQICIDLAYAVQRQSGTLRVLICQYGCSELSEILTAYSSLIESIKTCRNLSQLCLEVDPIFNLEEIEELIKSLPSLTLIYLVYLRYLREDPDTVNIFSTAKRLLEEAPASSKLSLFCFRSKWWLRHLFPGDSTEESACFFRPVWQEMRGFEEGPVIETNPKFAKYLIREPEILRKLEPWFVEELEPERWFEG